MHWDHPGTRLPFLTAKDCKPELILPFFGCFGQSNEKVTNTKTVFLKINFHQDPWHRFLIPDTQEVKAEVVQSLPEQQNEFKASLGNSVRLPRFFS